MRDWTKLASQVNVDVITGIITWKVPGKSRNIGKRAGHRTTGGYRAIKFAGLEYFEHTLIWFVAHGQVVYNLDHKDRCKINNRIDNLRPATNSKQQANTVLKPNACGARGVYWHKTGRKYYSQIRVNGKVTHIGFFDSLEEASAAYKREQIKLFGEFANG